MKAMKHVAFDFRCFVLHASLWAFQAVQLDEVMDGDGVCWKLSSVLQKDTGLLKSVYIEDPREVESMDSITTVGVCVWGDLGHKGIVFSEPAADEMVTLLQHTLLARAHFSHCELELALH